ncbi:MAG: ribonuclease III [Brevinematia bacterium]
MTSREFPGLTIERRDALLSFEQKIGVRFKDLSLLHQSLVHSSYVKYNALPSIMSNERLEFVGDALISMVISEYLYRNYPNFDEGMLSSVKADVVSRKIMYDIGIKIGIDEYILTVPSLDKFDYRGRRTIISNTFEALVGAMFLSNGLETTKDFVLKLFLPAIESRIRDGTSDFKSLLQHYVVRSFDTYPDYLVVSESGPDHQKEFLVKVLVNGKVLGEGRGFSKKEAEQYAAKNALENLNHVL